MYVHTNNYSFIHYIYISGSPEVPKKHDQGIGLNGSVKNGTVAVFIGESRVMSRPEFAFLIS